MQIVIDGNMIDLDSEGFLKNLNDWNKQVALELARYEQITLTDRHWEIIDLARDFYRTYQISPSMRALIKYIQQKLGVEKGQSIYLLQLFPRSPAKYISKIAGLPKPANCL
jgi:tRNA 2-thiouridine synthesizing protein E